MIIRHARIGNQKSTAGPNKKEFCVQCQAVRNNGYWIHDRVMMGPTGIFVCDDCLAAAKKHGALPKPKSCGGE